MLVAVAVFGQTLVNYPTDIRNGPYASDAGPVGKTLPQLCTGAGALPLALTQHWNAMATQTIPCVIVAAGGIIQPAAGQVVTFASMPSISGLQKIFDTSLGGPGSILFPQIGPSFASQPEWFGAVPQITSGALNGGAVNSAAFTAAQRALPIFGTNPNMVVMNLGTVKVANTGINYAYPLNSTFHLSPFTTLAGEDTQTAYMTVDHSGFTGSYLIDTINANGTGQTFNNNFNNGILQSESVNDHCQRNFSGRLH